MSDEHQFLHEAFQAQVRRTPQATAVIVGHRSLTYAEVNRQANRIAHTLRQRGVTSETLVGVCLPRDESLIPALLGVLKAGAAYVPLDPAYPQQRLALIVEDAQLHTVVTSAQHRDEPWLQGTDTVLIGSDEADDDTDPVHSGQPGDAAYVIYTSGTTGRPKGAVIEHRHLMNLLRWIIATYPAGAHHRSMCVASICHDFATVEIYPALHTGGAVVLAQNLLELPTLPARNEVTIVSGIPSALATVLADPLPASVRTVVAGGEVLSRALVNRLYAHRGLERVINIYGPTECTTFATAYVVPRDETGPVTLGTPVAGARLSIRDAAGDPLPDGAIGELWIHGPGVGRGYLNRPELNAQKFVGMPEGGHAYRTGDLVRVENGHYWFHGREDDQVKVRGYRIELGEIEVALSAHPSVRNAVVLADGERLLGFAESGDSDLSEKDLRAFLRESLPEHMVPSRVAVLDRIPLGPVGKADRRVLAAYSFSDGTGWEQLGNDETEQVIAGFVAAAVGRESVGIHDNFSDLGGHSLAAMRVCTQVRSTFGVPITLANFLTTPTVAHLAELVRTGQPAAPAAVRARSGGDLTAMQRSFWTTRTLTDSPQATTVAARLRLSGVTGAAAVQSALDALVARHEILRTSFTSDEHDVVASVCPPRPVPLTVEDGPLDAIADHAFDLTSGELLRAAMRWTGPQEAELVVATDHIAFDGWSFGILMEELAAHLAGSPNTEPVLQLRELPIDDVDSQVDYWRERLRGVMAPHDVPRTAPGPAGRLTRQLPADLVAQANALEVSPFAVYLAALGVLVSGYTGREDTLLGVPFAQRERDGWDRVIGPLLGTLPVRLAVSAEQPFRLLAAEAGREITDGLSHPATLDEMIAAVPRMPGTPALPILLSMQPDSAPVSVRNGTVHIELLGELRGGAGPDTLIILINRTVAGTELVVEHGSAAFLDSYLRVLEIALSAPDTKVGAIPLVGPAELDELLTAGCPSATEEPSHVVAAVLEQARLRPTATAVVAPDGELTYGELAELSARIASGLVGRGVHTGEIVGVCMQRSRLLMPALLGVLRAGAAYLPLDPEHPATRRDYQVADCAARFVLSKSDVEELATGHIGELPEPSTDLVYVLYTSGSTGQPKGVDVEHVSLGTNLVAMREVFGQGPGDVTLSVSPVSFDVAHLGMWLPLSNGAQCVLIDSATAMDGHALAARIAETGVTALLVPPTSLRMLMAADWSGGAQVRVMSAGEALDPALAREVIPRVGALWNGYGPTEAAIIATMHHVTEADATVPIGRPLPGYRVYLADESGRLVPPGVIGELWIAGPAVARGYRNRPELTKEAFRDDPHGTGAAYRTGDLVRWLPDRTIEYLGRRDHQVKVRGYRIELGEVETVLRDHPAVAHAVVTALGGIGETHLVGYVVWRQPAEFSDLESYLRGRLPEYMTPHRWVAMDALPLNHNGKVDRAALPAPTAAQRSRVEISTEMEEFIAEVWEEFLGVPDLHASDDFFALGGHSFAATQVIGRVWTVLGCRVPVKVLFENPMLSDFAAEVEQIALASL